jgi:hypothetical protein
LPCTTVWACLDYRETTNLGLGKSVVETLSEELQKEFPGISGFGKSSLRSMAQFYSEYQGNEFLQPLVGEISWSKHIVIMSECKDFPLAAGYLLVYIWGMD